MPIDDFVTVSRAEYEGLKKYNEIINNITALVGTIHNYSVLLRQIEEICSMETQADKISVVLRDNDELLLEIARGLYSHELKEGCLRVGEGIIGIVAKEGRAYLTNDAQNDPTHIRANDIDKITGYYPNAILAVPLTYAGKIIGVLELVKREGSFNETHKLLLEKVIASPIANLIEQAKISEELAKRSAEIYNTSIRDHLTGAYNRIYLKTYLEAEFERAKRYKNNLSVIYLDVDGFKFVNDTYGHDAGDATVKEAAQRLSQHLRDVDKFFRLGGDEFAYVLPQTGVNGAIIFCNRIRNAISEEDFVMADGSRLNLTASIGIAVFNGENFSNYEGLINRADLSMYVAKKSGKDTVVVYDSAKNRYYDSIKGNYLSLDLTNNKFLISNPPN